MICNVSHVLSVIFTLAARQYGVVSRAQLCGLGLTREAIRHLTRKGLLTAVHRDVLAVAGSPATFERTIWCALLSAGPEAVASHRLAARLHRLRGFGNEGIDVLIHERFHHSTGRGALHTTSWLPPEHATVVNGIPTTTIARTIFDLAGLSSPTRLRAGRPFAHEKRVARALDTALGNGLPLAEVANVVASLGTRGRAGTALMRRLVDARANGFVATESELEDLVIAVLAAHGLPLPERQRVLGGDERIGRVDFVYPRSRLVIEADGRPYHMSLLDRDSDRWRDTELVAAGWSVMRVTWHDLTHDPERFVRAVARVLGAALT
jgi:very-short-patch-repair endonuclease